jgi:hypothetical protein
MEKKKVKEEEREYRKQMLEMKRLKEQEKEREIREREMKREEERNKEEMILNQLKEEKLKKEQEEYDKWKDAFTVAEEGEDNIDINSEDLINEFINYIKLRKVVSLEDLSGQFKLNANDIVERLKVLESQGRICGIIDDRGKYIYMNEKEIQVIIIYLEY